MSFEFVKTGKSKGDGILTTNDNNFKVQYEKNQVTKKGDVTYYVCSEIRSGCQAKATVQLLLEFLKFNVSPGPYQVSHAREYITIFLINI